MTAVSLVDFRLHKPMTSGEIKSDTDVDIAPSQPAKKKLGSKTDVFFF